MQKATHLDTFNNSWYKPGSKLKIALWYVCNAVFLKCSLQPFSFVKIFFLRLFGAKIGEGVLIKPSVNIKYPWKLTIGNHVWIGENVWIDNLDDVVIGNHVCISQGALLLCGNHDYKKSTFALIVGKITMEDGVWIGAQAVVCGGVTCAEHSMLSVSSVTAKNLEAYSIYRGNPAEKIGERIIQ